MYFGKKKSKRFFLNKFSFCFEKTSPLAVQSTASEAVFPITTFFPISLSNAKKAVTAKESPADG